MKDSCFIKIFHRTYFPVNFAKFLGTLLLLSICQGEFAELRALRAFAPYMP